MKLDFSVEPHYIQLHALEQHGRIMLTLPEGVKKDELRTYCCSLGVINKSTYYVRKTEQANVFLIQRNDPRNPRNPHRSSYPYDALDCGQHFSIPKFQEYSQNSLRVHTYTEGKRLGKKFKVHEDKKNALYTITRTN